GRGETPGPVWEVIGPRIFTLHVRDARRVPDGEGWQLVLLGEGEVPAREASMCSSAAGYEAGWSWSGKALARQPSCWGRSLLFGHEGAGWLRLSPGRQQRCARRVRSDCFVAGGATRRR